MAVTVLTAIAEVGTVMSIAGGVTGNKGLMKVGAVMGLVGGIGAFAMGGMSGAAGAGLSAGENASSLGAVNGMDAMSDAFSASGAGASSAGGFSSTAGLGAAAEDASAAMGYLSDADAAGGLIQEATSAGESLKGAIDPMAAADASDAISSIDSQTTMAGGAKLDNLTAINETASSTPVLDANNPSSANYVNQLDAASDLYKPPVNNPASDYFKSFLKWVKENDKTANSLMTLGMGAFKGMAESDIANKKLAADATRYQYGNTVAKPYSPQALIGSR